MSEFCSKMKSFYERSILKLPTMPIRQSILLGEPGSTRLAESYGKKKDKCSPPSPDKATVILFLQNFEIIYVGIIEKSANGSLIESIILLKFNRTSLPVRFFKLCLTSNKLAYWAANLDSSYLELDPIVNA